jgi:hypothetical protein
MPAPAVFISYSHDSQEHKHWVLELATRLRSSGIDAILDQWELGPGSDLPQFMEQNLARSSRVLMICTERYVEKANAGVGGVGYEKMIVTADLLKRIGSNHVIPIVRQNGTVHLPIFLKTKLYIDLSTSDLFESGIDELLRDLLKTPLFVKPPLGNDPFEVTKGTAKATNPTPVIQFMQALADVYDEVNDAGLIYAELVRRSMKTSRLFFDHAFDQAIALQYVSEGSERKVIWVQEAGRAMLVKLQIDRMNESR